MTDANAWTHQYAWLPDFYANDRDAFEKLPRAFRDIMFKFPLTQDTVPILEHWQDEMNNSYNRHPDEFNSTHEYVTIMREFPRLIEHIRSTRPDFNLH
jgi:hypothetical protein